MKKCFYFPTWEEKKDVMINCDESCVITPPKNEPSVYFNTGNNIEQSAHGQYISQSTPSDPILQKLCELTGAKMYGDYLILDISHLNELELNEEGDEINLEVALGDVYPGLGGGCIKYDNEKYIISMLSAFIKDSCYACVMSVLQIDKPGYQDIIASGKFTDYANKLYNIFHEYSKYLCKEESKWEEIAEELILNI